MPRASFPSMFSILSGAALDSLVQAFHQGLIEAVRGHVGGNASSDGEAEEVEVADQVQNLVAHEFVGITKLRIDDLAVVHDDVGMEISAADLSEFLGHFDILKRVEGAGRGDVLCKRPACGVEREDLFAYGRRVVDPH